MSKVININATLKRTAELFARTNKDVEIIHDYQEDIWLVEADQGQIDQVLFNLYVNARQAMEKQDGERRLTVATEHDETHVVLD